MLLIYTHKITPRLKYTFKHICTHILGLEVTFTTKIETFIAHADLKLSYTKQALSNELFIKSHDLLFEQGLSDLEIHVQKWEDTKCFFVTKDSALPFDIFAASFYLLSRYEEYLPHVKDSYGRFTAKESLAYKNAFLQQPVVDMWAYKFKAILQAHFTAITLKKRSYSIKPVIDVPAAYNFKLKGIMRSLGGTFNDLVKFKFNQLYKRYAVIFGFSKDPFDTFQYIINKQKQVDFKFIVFFLLGDYSTFDKNINVQKQKFTALIKQVNDYCEVGLKVSYFALSNSTILKKEKQRLESVINTSAKASRQSYSKINIPESYRNLVDLEITQDYTMGYVDAIGFRAGTCTPFFFYDLGYEVQTPLQIFSYQILDRALFSYKSLLDKKKIILEMTNQIKAVNGMFVPIFHNYSFSGLEPWKGFKALFNIILDSK